MQTELLADAISTLSVDTFLPLRRMIALADTEATAYRRAQPFPHAVIDDFFDEGLLDRVRREFPPPGQFAWHQFNNRYEVKLSSSADSTFGPVTRLLMYHLNSISFLSFLSGLTGIPNLIPDPTFDGGGLHQIERGGKLGVHADFNRQRKYGLDRRLNVLIYLNADWKDEYGGHLELWNRTMTECEARVRPTFNRMVVFSTTDFTYHGHPDPLQCPQGMTRKSLALYYYTNGRPKHEISARHSTIFRARRQGEFGDLTLRERWREWRRARRLRRPPPA